ncbi:hypothetical protein K504DRAFT_305024 [Pleomassaria siparia CBS 279.74]|uniref:Uncharacterized protein n=1 Tax=Pleomassaria siparia CBS 279.74 TaxID=1314801 RepID=A0A6G1K754_9PLEO|nr:hypothetical protein K504DRAFT_305024 [Pleomassaria siparia CBS 279.74]
MLSSKSPKSHLCFCGTVCITKVTVSWMTQPQRSIWAGAKRSLPASRPINSRLSRELNRRQPQEIRVRASVIDVPLSDMLVVL